MKYKWKDDQNRFGNKLKEILEEKGITQTELSIKIGVTQATISRYITGKMVPIGPVISAIARELHVPVQDLMVW